MQKRAIKCKKRVKKREKSARKCEKSKKKIGKTAHRATQVYYKPLFIQIPTKTGKIKKAFWRIKWKYVVKYTDFYLLKCCSVFFLRDFLNFENEKLEKINFNRN